MARRKNNIMAALLSALVVVLSAVAAAPMTGARLGRNPGDAQVFGYVTDNSTHQPLAGVGVVVTDSIYINSTVTDPNGHYTIFVPAGDYTVTFSFEGYSNVEMPISVADDGTLQLDMALAPMSSTVTGTVSSAGNPVAGAAVLLVNGMDQMQASTNATGYFAFELLGYGQTYELRITSDGMYGFTDSFPLPLGSVKTETVNLAPIPGAYSTIWGYVFDSSSSLPIDGAMVTFTQRGSDLFVGALTASGGYYTVSLAAGYYDIVVEALHYLSFVTSLDVAGDVTDERDFTLSPVPAAGTGVSGQVTDRTTSLPIAGAQVSLIDANGARNTGTADAAGLYSITTYAGTFALEVIADGYFAHDEQVVVGASNMTKDISLIPVPAMTIMVWGYTKDITAQPVNGVMVTLYDLDVNHSGYLTTAVSATGGHYAIMTYPGHFLLTAEAAGYAISAADLSLAATQRQDIVLAALSPQDEDETITFSDWNNLSYTAAVTTQSTAGATRWEIDHNFGNGDGAVTQDEVDKYLATIQERGPQHRDTRGFLTVDGTIYKSVDGTYTVTAENAVGLDTDTTPLLLHYSYNLTANTTIAQATYHLLQFNETYDNAVSTSTSRFVLPHAFEMRKVVQATASVMVNGTSDVTITPQTRLAGATVGSELVILNISKNEPPFADTSGNQTVKPGTVVVVDGSTSSDDTSIANWSWDFGDGASGFGAVANHTYNVANGTLANFTVTLTVTDTGGLTNSTTLRVTVDGTPPVAAFTHGNLTVLQNTEPFEVNANSSSDDMGITRYFWTWGDGYTSEGAVTNHTYFALPLTEAKNYNVTLNVTDPAGNFATQTVVVTVLDNVPPLSRFIANVTVAPAGVPVEFNATGDSGASDNVGITQYVWDFGDNSTKVSGNVTQAGVLNHTYAKEGTYNVTLNVTDGRFYNETTMTMTITPPLIFAELRLQDVSFSNTNPVDGDKIQISVKLSNTGQKAATNFTVRFMDGTKKVKDVMVKSIEVGDTRTLTVDWTPKQGKHTIRVIADVISQVVETNETNNEVTANITAGANQTTTYILIVAVVVVVVILAAYFYSKKRAARAEDEDEEEEEEEEEEDEDEEEEESEEDEEHECPKCFAEVKASDKKCPSCGANLRR